MYTYIYIKEATWFLTLACFPTIHPLSTSSSDTKHSLQWTINLSNASRFLGSRKTTVTTCKLKLDNNGGHGAVQRKWTRHSSLGRSVRNLQIPENFWHFMNLWFRRTSLSPQQLRYQKNSHDALHGWWSEATETYLSGSGRISGQHG